MAVALGVGGQGQEHLLQAGAVGRPEFGEGDPGGPREVAYEFESLDFPAVQRLLNSYFAEFYPVAPDRMQRHQHPGAEFIYVLSGNLSIQIGDETHVIGPRDSIYFDATAPHAYSRNGSKPCCAIVVTTA